MNVTTKNEIVEQEITSRKYFPPNGIKRKLHTVSIWSKISYRNHPFAKTVHNTSRDGTPLTASSKLFSSFSRNCFISQWPALGDNKNTTH